MEFSIKMLRTCSIIFLCVFCKCAFSKDAVEPWIVSFNVDDIYCDQTICKYFLTVNGGPYLGFYPWRLTPEGAIRGSTCETYLPNYEWKEIKTSEWLSKVEIAVANSESRLYFCLHHSEHKSSRFGGKWIHQGLVLYLNPKRDYQSDIKTSHTPSENLKPPKNKQETITVTVDLTHDIDVNFKTKPKPSEYESNDIEISINDTYVPLNSVNFIYKNANFETTTNTTINSINTSDKIEKSFDVNDKNDNLIRRRRSVITSNDQASNISANQENITENHDQFKTANATTEKFLISPEEIRNAHKDTNYIKPKENNEKHEDALIKIRKQRQVMPYDFLGVPFASNVLKLNGIRIESSDREPKIAKDIPSVLSGTKVSIRLFGAGFTQNTVIAFTDVRAEYGQPCKYLLKGEYKVKTAKDHTAVVDIIAPSQNHEMLYICAKNLRSNQIDHLKDVEKYIHQGTDPWVVFATHEKVLPLWLQIMFIMICLSFSALFSGLNLGLMSLDKTELKIIANTGSLKEKSYASTVMPVRDHGNFLLCSILLGNVAVNSTLTLLLDDLTSGLFAVIFATLLIVMLGEIAPQAFCTRHGLMVGAKTVYITKAVMAVQAPLAYPISKLLDYILGEELGNVYNRERLKELVRVTRGMNDLDKYEVNIISGALELRKKCVADIMTKIEDVFMLPITAVLDFETMNEIINSGYSRIPVFESNRTNIITVLFVKDLAFVDPDDNTPLKTLCQYYQNPCNFVFEDVTLDVMFRQFKEGSKGHMAFVHRINDQGDTDPFYETIGLVTLEDVIEEMIQAEILDETDVYTDNTNRRRRLRPSKLQDFSVFAQRKQNKTVNISPQLTLATFQFLSTSVDEFKPEVISETVLRRLLKQDIFHQVKVKGKTKKDPSIYVYQAGKPVDYFVLILEGRVEVTVGRENLVFEAGPFTYFGVQALAQNVGMQQVDSSPTLSTRGSLSNINMDSILRHSFVPDYSVRAVTELYYLTVRRSLYLAAKRASLMEQGVLAKGEQFETEVDKLLEGVDSEDLMSIPGDNKTPSRQISPNPAISVKSSPILTDRNGELSGPPPDERDKLLM